MDLQAQKQELREKLLRSRSELSREEYRIKSGQIISRLKQQAEFNKACIIHCYVSMNERKEVNTLPLIKELIESDKKLAVPITNFENGTLTHTYLKEYNDLRENKWGVMEPPKGRQANPEDLDLVIVPMAGGDLQKNRIGYGKGFYDRFLQQLKCPSIGLLFERCLVDTVPAESFDVPLDKLITEEKIIY